MVQEVNKRINKYLAECGVCSRREADRLIEAKKVTIDGKIAGMGDRVCDNQVVKVGNKVIGNVNAKVILAYYKPVGVTCTEKDEHAKITIRDAFSYPIRVSYAGRLDKDSEGLLLMTNDGELIQNMMRGANGHEKEYIVKVDSEIDKNFLEKMSKGVFLKELEKTTRPCQIEAIGKYTFRIILTQGLNRQIRRMCEANGKKVLQLKRVRIVNINLGTLKSGEHREIKGKELEELYKKVGMLNAK